MCQSDFLVYDHVYCLWISSDIKLVICTSITLITCKEETANDCISVYFKIRSKHCLACINQSKMTLKKLNTTKKKSTPIMKEEVLREILLFMNPSIPSKELEVSEWFNE